MQWKELKLSAESRVVLTISKPSRSDRGVPFGLFGLMG